MRTLLLLIGLILFIPTSYTQECLPKAEIAKNTKENSTEYSFKSNYYIPEWKVPKLEKRLTDRYQEIKTISIDSETQIVSFSLNKDVNPDTFIKLFVKHFKFSGYEIL
jgi:hypothetical protein